MLLSNLLLLNVLVRVKWTEVPKKKTAPVRYREHRVMSSFTSLRKFKRLQSKLLTMARSSLTRFNSNQMPTCSQEIKLIAKKKRAKLMTARIVTIFHRREFACKSVLCSMKELHRVRPMLLPLAIMVC